MSSDLPGIPVPAYQLVTLEKKLNKAKAQLKRKTTKADKLKVRQLERKFFQAKGMSGNSRKRKAPAERDNFQRQLSTCLRASEEDKQKLAEQLTNAQDMVKKLRTENLGLKIKIRNIEQIQQKTTKRNEELKMTIKMLQQEQLIYSNLIKKPNTFKYLCGLSVEQFNILWNCVRPYCHVIIYPDCKGNGERTLDKATELLAVLTICRHSLHQGVMAYMLKVGESTVQPTFVAWIVFLETIFNCIDLKPEAGFLLKNARHFHKDWPWTHRHDHRLY